MSDFTLFSEDAQRIQKLLQAFQTTLKADYLMLCHRDGSVISEVGTSPKEHDVSTLSVLVVASYSSATQIGRSMGEHQLKTINYVGTHKSICISAVDQTLLLVQIFSGNTIPPKLEEYVDVLTQKLLSVVPGFVQSTSQIASHSSLA